MNPFCGRLLLPGGLLLAALLPLLGIVIGPWFALPIGVLLAAFWMGAAIRFCVRPYQRLLGRLEEGLDALGEGRLDHRLHLQEGVGGSLIDAFNRAALSLERQVAVLGEEKARFLAILTHMTHAVILLTPRKRILLINPAAEEMFGVPRQMAEGQYHLSVIHDYALDSLLDRVMAEGKARKISLHPVLSGEQVLEVHLVPVGDGGGLLLLAQDVTEVRRMERLRRDFVANVSHELRTPLTSIKGFAETLLSGAGEDAEIRDRFLSIINEEADRLTRLIDDLLDLSRYEAQNPHAVLRPIDLAQVARAVAHRFQTEVERQGHTLTVEGQEGLVLADRDQMERVLTNLIGNAVKYTPAGGSISVRVERKEDEVEVSVRDNGVGIPRRDLPRIFERFYRVEKGRSRETGGTGLGLSIVKHLVEGHGGKVGVESLAGTGSRFWFRLPAHREAPAAKGPQEGMEGGQPE